MRRISQATAGKDTAAPTPAAIRSTPTSAALRSRSVLMAGMRAAQVAYWKPRDRNSAAIANWPRRKGSWRRDTRNQLTSRRVGAGGRGDGRSGAGRAAATGLDM